MLEGSRWILAIFTASAVSMNLGLFENAAFAWGDFFAPFIGALIANLTFGDFFYPSPLARKLRTSDRLKVVVLGVSFEDRMKLKDLFSELRSDFWLRIAVGIALIVGLVLLGAKVNIFSLVGIFLLLSFSIAFHPNLFWLPLGLSLVALAIDQRAALTGPASFRYLLMGLELSIFLHLRSEAYRISLFRDEKRVPAPKWDSPEFLKPFLVFCTAFVLGILIFPKEVPKIRHPTSKPRDFRWNHTNDARSVNHLSEGFGQSSPGQSVSSSSSVSSFGGSGGSGEPDLKQQNDDAEAPQNFPPSEPGSERIKEAGGSQASTSNEGSRKPSEGSHRQRNSAQPLKEQGSIKGETPNKASEPITGKESTTGFQQRTTGSNGGQSGGGTQGSAGSGGGSGGNGDGATSPDSLSTSSGGQSASANNQSSRESSLSPPQASASHEKSSPQKKKLDLDFLKKLKPKLIWIVLALILIGGAVLFYFWKRKKKIKELKKSPDDQKLRNQIFENFLDLARKDFDGLEKLDSLSLRDRVIRLYNLFLAYCEHCSIGKPIHYTPDEFSEALGRLFPTRKRELRRISAVFCLSLYGNTSPRPEFVKQYSKDLLSMGEQIKVFQRSRNH
jgi:uncharacterized membrane protein YgcG